MQVTRTGPAARLQLHCFQLLARRRESLMRVFVSAGEYKRHVVVATIWPPDEQDILTQTGDLMNKTKRTPDSGWNVHSRLLMGGLPYDRPVYDECRKVQPRLRLGTPAQRAPWYTPCHYLRDQRRLRVESSPPSGKIR